MIKQKLQAELESMDVTDMLMLYSYIQRMKRRPKVSTNKVQHLNIDRARSILKKCTVSLSKEIILDREDRL